MGKICYGCMKEYDEGLDTCPFCRLPAGIPQPEPSHLSAGTVLRGRYLTGRVLGYGGFGVTYIGLDQLLGRRVAVKEYLPGEFATRVPAQTKVTVYSGEKGEQFRTGLEKFTEESRRLAKFQDIPEIVHIFDCFEENETAYIVMEYLEGETLKDRLERTGRMEYEEALPILLDVLHALEKVHAEGMLHRDVAPDNVFLTKDGRTKLIDFGAARFATTTHSRSLTVLIKPGYCPEEQYRSRGDQGTWTDVYAAAATAYRMITGVTPDDALERAVQDKLQRPSKLGVKIPKAAENAILNALNVKADGRTQTAEAFEKELTGAGTGRHKAKVRQSDLGRWPLWGRLAAVLGLAAFLGTGVLWFSGVIRLSQTEKESRPLKEGQIYMPNLVNLPREEAEAVLQERGLQMQIVDKKFSTEIPEGRVLEQDVRAGAVVADGTAVHIGISAGIRKVEMPYLFGMQEDQARALLEEMDLVPVIEREERFFASGTVFEQGVPAGEAVQTGTEVRLISSDGMGGGDESVIETMDDYTGMNYEKALEDAAKKFIYLINAGSEYSDTLPEGDIIRQEVEEGDSIPQNTNVGVIISQGKEMVHVPDLQYKSAEEAAKRLDGLGLAYTFEEERSATVQEGHVVHQSPEADKRVEKNSAVTLYLSRKVLTDQEIFASEDPLRTVGAAQTELGRDAVIVNEGFSRDPGSGEVYREALVIPWKDTWTLNSWNDYGWEEFSSSPYAATWGNAGREIYYSDIDDAKQNEKGFELQYEYTSAYTDLIAFIDGSPFSGIWEVRRLDQSDYREVTVNGHTYTTAQCSFEDYSSGSKHLLFAEEKRTDGCNLYCYLAASLGAEDAWMQDTLLGGLQYYEVGFGGISAAAGQADVLLRPIGDEGNTQAGRLAFPGNLPGSDLMSQDDPSDIQRFYSKNSILYNMAYEKAIFTYFESGDGAKLLEELQNAWKLRFVDTYIDVQAGEITKQTYRGKDTYVQYLTYKPIGSFHGTSYDSEPFTEVRMARRINGHTLLAQYIGQDDPIGIGEQDLEDILERFWSWDDNSADSTGAEP